MTTKQITVLTLASLTFVVFLSFSLMTNTWKVNANEAKIHFNMPVANHTGEVSGLQCTFQFDPLNPKNSMINATVDVNTLKSDNEKLTAHLHSADFFDVANHPTITFKSDSVTKNDTAFVAYGKLTMRDSTKSVMIPFKFLEEGNKALVKGNLDLYSGDYGVGKKSPTGKDHTLLTIEVPVAKE